MSERTDYAAQFATGAGYVLDLLAGKPIPELRCYMLRYTVTGGGWGYATVIDRSEDQARATLIDAFDYRDIQITIDAVTSEDLYEGRYLTAEIDF